MTRRFELESPVVLVFIALVAAGCSASTGDETDDMTQAPPPSAPPSALAATQPGLGMKGIGSVGASTTTTDKMSDPTKTTDPVKIDRRSPTVDAKPTSDAVSYADAELLFSEKRFEEAVTLFTVYTEQRPDNPWGHYMRGLSSWKAGDAGQAEEAFSVALLIDPAHVKSLVNLSRVLIEQRRPDEAFERLAVAREIEPTSAVIHRLLGRAHSAQGNTEDAIAAYRRAIVLDDHDAWSMNNLGVLLLELGRAGEAVPPLARAVELRDDLPMLHNNLGMALEHTGRLAAAADAYDAALIADPTHEKAQLNYAHRAGEEGVAVRSVRPAGNRRPVRREHTDLE